MLDGEGEASGYKGMMGSLHAKHSGGCGRTDRPVSRFWSAGVGPHTSNFRRPTFDLQLSRSIFALWRDTKCPTCPTFRTGGGRRENVSPYSERVRIS